MLAGAMLVSFPLLLARVWYRDRSEVAGSADGADATARLRHHTLRTEEVMLPGPALTGRVNLLARVQTRGTVAPLQPGDLVGHYAGNPVAVGTTGVDVVLTPQR